MKFVLLFVVFLYFSAISRSQNPGIQIRVNSNGINFAQGIAARDLTSTIRNFRRSRINVDGGHVSNVRMTSFNLGSTSATTSIPNRFRLAITNANLAGTFDFRVNKKVWFFTVTARGNGRISANRISINQEIRLSRDSNGRPRVSPGSCRASIGDLDYSLRGNLLSWLINLFRGFLKNTFRRMIEREICPGMRTFLINFDRNELRRINTNFPFLHSKINLDLMRDSAANSNGLTVAIKGQCFSRSRRTSPSSPFPPRRVSLPTSSSRMVQIVITDYVFDTLLHTMWRENRFRKTFSHANIEQIGKTFQPLRSLVNQSLQNGAKYSIEITTTSAPDATITTRGITLSFPVRIRVYAIPRGRSKQLLQTLNLRVEAAASTRVSGNKVVARVESLEITTSDTGGISKSFLDKFLNSALRKYVVPIVNGVAESGFKFPEFFEYRVSRPEIRYQPGYIVVESDFTHS